MGTVYYLARPDNRTLFELGKWCNLGGLFHDMESPLCRAQTWVALELPSEAELLAGVTWYHRDWNRATSEIDVDAYIAEVVRRLIAFAGGKPLELLNDCSSEFGDGPGDGYMDANDELNVTDDVFTSHWGDWAAQHRGPGATS